MKTSVKGRPRDQVDTREYLAMLRRLVRAAGTRVGNGDADDFGELQRIHEELQLALLVAAAGLRASGHTWQDIGAATGTTRQAALMRWGSKLS